LSLKNVDYAGVCNNNWHRATLKETKAHEKVYHAYRDGYR
jgi:hypothetical protein